MPVVWTSALSLGGKDFAASLAGDDNGEIGLKPEEQEDSRRAQRIREQDRARWVFTLLIVAWCVIALIHDAVSGMPQDMPSEVASTETDGQASSAARQQSAP